MNTQHKQHIPLTPLQRAQGCLLGQLAGDSLGGLVEFTSVKDILRRYPDGCRDLHDGGTWGILAGQPTDDSELALSLARSLVGQDEYLPDRTLTAYRHWLKSNPFDVGGTIGQALRNGEPNYDSQANGSLMRISPLGIFGARFPRHLVTRWAREDSALTHPHPVCQDACGVFVAALHEAINSGTTRVENIPHRVSLAALNEAKTVEVSNVLRQAAGGYPVYTNNIGWVLIGLQNAFYRLLHSPSLEDGIVDTVMSGGDTDTNGAIVGALLGAVYGRPGIPSRWEEKILSCRPDGKSLSKHPRPMEYWPVDALTLAEQLLTGKKS